MRKSVVVTKVLLHAMAIIILVAIVWSGYAAIS